jgi:small acid-soluble spore protein F (minor alpha/beta-type SASP)
MTLTHRVIFFCPRGMTFETWQIHTSVFEKRRRIMGRRTRGIMTEQFKMELSKDLGFYDVVKQEGWQAIKTQDAGNMVKRAIQIAEEQLAKKH